MWVLPLHLKAREKKLRKPLKELNMCSLLFGRHRRLVSELYLKNLKDESLEEVAKGCILGGSCPFRVCHSKRIVIFPKDQIWVDDVEESQPGVVLVLVQEEASVKGGQN